MFAWRPRTGQMVTALCDTGWGLWPNPKGFLNKEPKIKIKIMIKEICQIIYTYLILVMCVKIQYNILFIYMLNFCFSKCLK